MQRRLKEDSGHLSDDFDLKYVRQALGDWKIWVHMLLLMSMFTAVYSFALFLPTIIKNMGYTSNEAQLMSVPPYVMACVATITGSYFADRLGQRGPFMLGFMVVAVVGFALLVSTDRPGVQYAGTIFAAIGTLRYWMISSR